MSEFTVPESVASQLQGVLYPVQLYDPSGKKLGRFVPEVDLSEYELDPEPTEEELRQAEESDEWFTTDEVLRHLEKLS